MERDQGGRSLPIRRRSTKALPAALVTFMTCSTPLAAETCERQHGIWARDTDDGHWIVYFADNLHQMSWNTFFELWRGNERLARIRAEIGCSNGIYRCYMGFENLDAPTDEAEQDAQPFYGSIPYVEIYESAGGGDGVRIWGLEQPAPPDWLVFAHFTENVASIQKYAQKVSTSVRLYTDEIPDTPFLLPPSDYRFMGCRNTAFSPEPYGSPDLYQPADKTR